MSSEEPDSLFILKSGWQIDAASIVMLNFNKNTANNKVLTDSLA
jgi:hypothetical protein